MAKINIPFGNTNYSIEESALAAATAQLKSHLSTEMNGSGAVINLGGTSYNVDSTKLSTATNAFVSHLGTIAGSGSKVVVNGVEYSVDSAKLSGAVADLHATLGGLHSDDNGGTGREDYMPYWGETYSHAYNSGLKAVCIFYEDGSERYELYENGVFQGAEELPAGTVTFVDGEMFVNGTLDGTISKDGTQIITSDGTVFTLEQSTSIFPIAWNTKEVSMSNAPTVVYKQVPYIKVSDVLPSKEELTRTCLNMGDAPHPFTTFQDLGAGDNIVCAVYTRDGVDFDSIPVMVVYQAGNYGGLEISETGLYCIDIYGFVQENWDFVIDYASNTDTPTETYTAGLYQTGAIALYEEQGSAAIEGMMIKSWDELVAEGEIVVDNTTVMSVGYVAPDNLPEKNEYGFYFGVSYGGVVFYEDGSCKIGADVLPAGTIVYGNHIVDMSAIGEGVAQVSDDGRTLVFEFYNIPLGDRATLSGDLLLPDDGSITAISDFAFEFCEITNVILPESISYVGESAFSECYNLTSATLSASAEYGNSVFGSTGLTSVIIPNGMTKIVGGMFFCCENLTNITIPDSVTSIDVGAFQACRGIISVEIPDSVTSIGWGAFEDCTSLANIVIPNGVTIIDTKTFCGCTGLTSVVIPASVTTIEQNAFLNCTNLSSITFEGTMAQWNDISKGYNGKYGVPATEVVCSDGTVSLGK